MAGSVTLDFPTSPAMLKGHIKLFHGVWVDDVKERDELVECHRYCHTVKEIGSPIEHQHVKSSPARGRRG